MLGPKRMGGGGGGGGGVGVGGFGVLGDWVLLDLVVVEVRGVGVGGGGGLVGGLLFGGGWGRRSVVLVLGLRPAPSGEKGGGAHSPILLPQGQNGKWRGLCVKNEKPHPQKKHQSRRIRKAKRNGLWPKRTPVICA